MARFELVMPKMGESIMEATVLKWHKKPGDTVKNDETLLEIATDKVDSEVPSTAAGVITEILFKENDVVLSASPEISFLLFGMPCTTSSLTEAQITAGKPW